MRVVQYSRIAFLHIVEVRQCAGLQIAGGEW